MNSIDISLPNIIAARDLHYKYLRYIIKKKLNGTSFTEAPPIIGMNRVNKDNGIPVSIKNFMNEDENLQKILIGTPKELNTLKNRFASGVPKKAIKNLINYEAWINTGIKSTFHNYNAYHLARKLDIPTCTYCNRIYTKTVETVASKKVTRPTFDHWFPQSKYPLLALSFYNLIPSCSICNSHIKGSVPFSLETHFHPYHKNPLQTLDYTFSYDHKDYDKFSFKIITKNKFSKRSIDAFQLQEIFEAHEDEIEDLRKIKDAYSNDYIDILRSKILPVNGGLTREEVYRLAFGVHYQEAKFDRRPLSKMKKDILKELGII